MVNPYSVKDHSNFLSDPSINIDSISVSFQSFNDLMLIFSPGQLSEIAKSSNLANPAYPAYRGQSDCHQYLVDTKLCCIVPLGGE